MKSWRSSSIAVVLLIVFVGCSHAQMQSIPIYSDYYKGKPAVYVYWIEANSNPDPNRLKIYFLDDTLGWFTPDNGEWGIDKNAPQAHPKVNGVWQVYFIATRFIWMHTSSWDWNNDVRWRAYYDY